MKHAIDKLDELRGEALMVWGNQDTHIPYDGLTDIRAAFKESGANFTWVELNAAHAFMRDESRRAKGLHSKP